MELPIIFLDKEELLRFADSGDLQREGIAYEWEGEQVVHVKMNPSLHSYGKVSKAVFIKAEAGQADLSHISCRYLVRMVSSDDAVLYEMIDGKSVERTVCYIPSSGELYSRSKGILEVDILESKRVLIIGLGSFGSRIAIELAKAGVGSFSLFDFDRVELHNLARHTCTVHDLGRLKTDAIYDAILGKNPYAKVDRFSVNINEQLTLLYEEVGKADLVICTTDNNQSRFNIMKALVKQQRTGIIGRAVTRAEGGDVFRYRPGGPCYCCLIGTGWYDVSAEEITNLASARRNGQIAAYVSDEEADAVVQVGLSSDIEPICNLMVKLALVELSKGLDSGISCLEEELVYDYYMWANRRERRHANWAAMPNAGNKPTVLRWYGAHIRKDDECPLCSDQIRLDEGEDDEENFDLIVRTFSR